jgi:hypothetical protein
MYKEARLAYIVGDPHNPNNYPVYVVDRDLGNCILSIDDDIDECIEKRCTEKEKIEKINKNVYSMGIWKMYFDGASSC